MKKNLFFALAVMGIGAMNSGALKCSAQTVGIFGSTNLGVNNTGAYGAASSVFDISSTTGGLLVPRMTTAQRDAIPTPAISLLIYNTDVNEYQYYNGSGYSTVAAGTSPWSKSGGNIFLTTGTDNVGIGTTTPGAKLDIQPGGSYTNSLLNIQNVNASNGSSIFQVLTNGTGPAINVSQTGWGMAASIQLANASSGTDAFTITSNGNSSKTLNLSHTGATGGSTDYTLYSTNSGGGATNIAGYFSASGATNNYSAIFDQGNVGIGTISPAALLSVGTSSPFQVNSSGNILKINNVTTSFPAAQGGANSILSNDGSGTLSWSGISSLGGVTGVTASAPLTSSGGTAPNISLGTVGVGNGGTGAATFTTNALLLGNGTSPVSSLALGTANQILGMNAAATANEYKTINGTANQILVANAAGSITLSTPQNINNTASPTFSGLTLSGLTANSFLYSGAAGALTTTAAPTNGQLLIGSTGVAPVKAALTAGSGINITNGAGSISIATTGGTLSGGTTNYFPKWSSATSLSSTSLMYDNGSGVGIGTTSPSSILHLASAANTMQYITSSADPAGTLAGIKFLMYVSATNTHYDIAAEKTDAVPNSGAADLVFRKNFSTAGGYLTFLKYENSTQNVLLNSDKTTGSAFGNVLIPNGNVGIGTNSPSQKLDVVSSGGQSLVSIDGTGNSGILLKTSGTQNWAMYHNNAQSALYFYSNSMGDAPLVIQNGGNVGIGSLNPSSKLDVVSSVAGSVARLRNNSASGWSSMDFYNNAGTQMGAVGYANASAAVHASNMYISATNSSTPLVFGTVDTERMRITTTGNVGIGTAAPDATLHSLGGSAKIISDNANTTYSGGGKMYPGAYYYATILGGGGGWSGADGGGMPGAKFIGGNGGTSYGGGGAGIVAIGGNGAPFGRSGAGIYAKAGTDGASASDGVPAVAGYFDGNSKNAILAMNGNVGIGTTTPTSLLDVGATSQFQVNSSGNIVKLNNVTTSFPGANASGSLTNNGSGTLSWTGAGATGGGLPSGTSGQTLRHDGAVWSANSVLFNNGTNVGIGSTTPVAKLDVLTSLGTGNSGSFSINNASNPDNAVYGTTNGTGYAGYFLINNAANANSALVAGTTGTGEAIYGSTVGTGVAGYFTVSNASNASSALQAETNGTGNAIWGFTNGTGRAGYFNIANATNASDGLFVTTNGTGKALKVSNTNVAAGTKYGVYSTAVSAAGNTGVAGYFSSTGAGTNIAGIFDQGNVGIGTSAPLSKLNVSGTSQYEAALLLQNFAANTTEPRIMMTKSRNAAIGGNTIVSTNDITGQIGGWGNDGSTYWPNGTIEFEVDGVPGLNDMPGRITFNTTPDGSQILSERMRITSTGNIGIGTTNPVEILQIKSIDSDIEAETFSAVESSSLHIKRARGTIAAPTIISNGDYFGGVAFEGFDGSIMQPAGRIQGIVDGVPGAGDMPGRIEFWTTADGTVAEAVRMTIKNTGNVGIGTTAPASSLDVVDDMVSNDSPAISGTHAVTSNYGIGVQGKGGWKGVNALNTSTTGTNYGVYSAANGAGATTNYGIYSTATGATTNWAGYFQGNVHVNGTLSKNAGTFKIDHPLDPANKFLSHSFVESPDMMNIYNGIVVLDYLGNAVVTLPDYFNTLNKDFRYQLTPVGGPMPDLNIASEISNNSFTISGGKPGKKVSWEVTGIRKDPYAVQHPVIVEQEKNAQEKGHYLNPELYNQPKSKAIDFEKERRD